jgi:DNA-binding NtrC family response regulator
VLARFFVERFCRDLKKKALTLSPEALEVLTKYRWPGNVRELQNCIERAVILTDGDTIFPRHLNLSFAAPIQDDTPESPWAHVDLSGSLTEVTRRVTAEVEKAKIEAVLTEAGGNRGRAAELLQIGYKTLLAKLREHGIPEN